MASLGIGMLSGIGRSVNRVGSSKLGMSTVAAGALGLGVVNSTAPAIKDAALESDIGLMFRPPGSRGEQRETPRPLPRARRAVRR